jgi:hypothetical protein
MVRRPGPLATRRLARRRPARRPAHIPLTAPPADPASTHTAHVVRSISGPHLVPLAAAPPLLTTG